jgi:hypothetical protein
MLKKCAMQMCAIGGFLIELVLEFLEAFAFVEGGRLTL